MPLFPDVDLEKLAEFTHGFVGAALAAFIKEAGMLALRRILSHQAVMMIFQNRTAIWAIS